MHYRAGYKSHRRTVYINRIMINIIIDVNASRIKIIIFYFIYSLRRRHHHRYYCRQDIQVRDLNDVIVIIIISIETSLKKKKTLKYVLKSNY